MLPRFWDQIKCFFLEQQLSDKILLEIFKFCDQTYKTAQHRDDQYWSSIISNGMLQLEPTKLLSLRRKKDEKRMAMVNIINFPG